MVLRYGPSHYQSKNRDYNEMLGDKTVQSNQIHQSNHYQRSLKAVVNRSSLLDPTIDMAMAKRVG